MQNYHEIYDINIHENTYFEGFYVTRVPGGWLYTDELAKTSTFVPYNDEFLIKDESDKTIP